jgi:DNA segregation ATPase FtsK/SpoIIIE-like protein
MSYFIFVIDEVVLLTRDNKCKNKLHDIMCIGRKYGCYFILCLQDATKDTIGKCKMNCPQVIGLKTNDETDSSTIIGKNHNLQDIKDPGRCKVKSKNGVVEVQSYFIDEDTIDKLLRPYLKE